MKHLVLKCPVGFLARLDFDVFFRYTQRTTAGCRRRVRQVVLAALAKLLVNSHCITIKINTRTPHALVGLGSAALEAVIAYGSDVVLHSI